MTNVNKKSDARVSVLISTYNRPHYVGLAIESVLRQRYEDFELIVVRDGGAPIDEIMRRYDDARIRYINRDRNRGVAYSFNEAISHAGGEYIAYLGDDDLYYPDHLETLVDALDRHGRFGAAYTDLYKAHCVVRPGYRREVLSKNVEISRDFDRLLMLQFNHVLHVSLMHRKDIFEKAGGYNENLNVLIDWDLTRKLVFYTDFLHVPRVTGEYYAPVEDCDRISVVRRKDPVDYNRNVLAIRSTRPPKSWPKIKDMAVIVPADAADERLRRTLRDIWAHGFYPHQIFVALPAEELSALRTEAANVLGVSVPAGLSQGQKFNAVLAVTDAEYIAVVSAGAEFRRDEDIWLEKPLHALMLSDDPMQGFEMQGSRPGCFARVVRREQARRARRLFPDADVEASLEKSGMRFRVPEPREYPFGLDLRLSLAEELARQGRWSELAPLYEQFARDYGNALWMNTRRAAAMLNGGDARGAAEVIGEVNAVRPTVAAMLLEARAHRTLGNIHQAMELLEAAEAQLAGTGEAVTV